MTCGTPTQPTIAPARAERSAWATESSVPTLENCVRADPVGHLHDLFEAFVAPLSNDVGCPEGPGYGLSVGVAAHRDDPLGSELGGREHTGEADRPVADNHDGAAGSDIGADRRVPPGAHDVREREKARHQRLHRALRSRQESAVGVLDADQLCLAPVVACAVLAVGMGARLTKRAGVVAGEETSEDELPWPLNSTN